SEQGLTFLLCFFLMHVVEGLSLSFVFLLGHLVEVTHSYEYSPEDRAVDHSWAEHQLRTTANFGIGSRTLNFLCGGLNFQIEHHLFPNICHVHYPSISRIVQQTAAEYGLPYHCYPSLSSSLGSHFRFLRQMGIPADEAGRVKFG
ncbi:MAG: fatty acid desaturase, partial [Saprospiraceae bacterium]|nr:fatty acid desaturase [Saprospiraceae bacterium]